MGSIPSEEAGAIPEPSQYDETQTPFLPGFLLSGGGI